jgi:SynChlorMet cassette radical SAM/SPASM protein ScmE
VRVTVHHLNVNDLEATARLLLDDLGLPAFTTNAAGYLGTCCLNAQELLLSPNERQEAMTTLVRLTQRYPGRISGMAGPLADAHMWAEMERARTSGLESLPGRGRLTGCGCPFSKIAVRADGVIVVCNLLPTLELGRINDDDLGALWTDHPLLQSHRQRQSIPLKTFDLCTDCDYVDYCTGNCPATAFTHTGRADVPSPDSCLRLFLQAGGRLVEVPDA